MFGALVVRNGGIPPLVALLRDGTPDTQMEAAGALELLAESAEFHALIVDAGAVPPLLALVRDGAPDAPMRRRAGRARC